MQTDMRGIRALQITELSKVIPMPAWVAELVELLIYAAIAFVLAFILIKIHKKVIRKKLKTNNSIKLRFTQNLVKGLIIVIAVVWVLVSSSLTSDFGKVIFQGTAIIGAVIGLAAQPVISDLFCGLMISFNKPFDIGDRIELDNGVKGVVMDITSRHVVIRSIDTVDVIIPNSKINACVVTNMSRNTKIRSVHLRINVAYGTDVKKAMEVIRRVVVECEHTIPAWKGENYGPVYFIAYADSSLVLATTIYYQPTIATEMVLSDINLRIDQAFREEGIEIPFNYLNVVMKPEESTAE